MIADHRAYFEEVLHLRHGGKAQRNVRCPFHEDKQASLSLNMEKGLWTCHAGCGSGDRRDFERRLNGGAAAPVPKPNGHAAPPIRVAARRVAEAVYEYPDADGNVLFRKQRFPGKQFVLQQPKGSSWVNNLDGVTARPLYNLPSVLAAKHVAFCEGEKDVERLKRVLPKDWAATTNFDGADGKWRDEYQTALAGKDVVILPDNDEAGGRHAEVFARGAQSFGALVRYLSLPEVPEKGDVSDYLDTHAEKTFLALLKKAPAWQDPLQSLFLTAAELAAHSPTAVPWLVPDMLAFGNSANLQADLKLGKSTFTHHMIRAVLDGKLFLGRKTEKTPVVYLTEMPRVDLLAQLKACGLAARTDLHILLWHDALQLTWAKAVEAAMVRCRTTSARLLVIDTLSVWSRIEHENDASEMLAAFRPLDAAIAEGIGVWIQSHERKSGGVISQSGRGSNALGGKVGTIISLRRPKGNHPATYRELEVVGRHSCFTEILELCDSGYEVRGTRAAVVQEQITKKVLGALPSGASDALTLPQLLKMVGGKRSTVQDVLKAGLRYGTVLECVADPKLKVSKKNPKRYYKVGPKLPKS